MKTIVSIETYGSPLSASFSEYVLKFIKEFIKKEGRDDSYLLVIDAFDDVDALLEEVEKLADRKKIKIFTGFINAKKFAKYKMAFKLAKNCYLEQFSPEKVFHLVQSDIEVGDIQNINHSFQVVINLNDLEVFYKSNEPLRWRLSSIPSEMNIDTDLFKGNKEKIGQVFILSPSESIYDMPILEKNEMLNINPNSNGVALENLKEHLNSMSNINEALVKEIAKILGDTVIDIKRQPKLFLDISTLISFDHATGIQRVVKEISSILMKKKNIDCELIYSYAEHDHFYYPEYVDNSYQPANQTELADYIVDFSDGDKLLFLDLHPSNAYSKLQVIKNMRLLGVESYFVVYDLLPISHPHYFVKELVLDFHKWLNVVVKSNGALCISQDVSSKLNQWIVDSNQSAYHGFINKFFHLGADFDSSVESTGKHELAIEIDKRSKNAKSFLMVGTVEPRKGHSAVLDAFDSLWNDGDNEVLIIVGKAGWKNEKFIKRLSKHKEINKKLFWLKNVSDEYLEFLYNNCSCLIAASEGEGFGLPLIEAAHYKLPIIARDIPVFQEVAGNYSLYFSGSNLKEKIAEWISLNALDKHPKSEMMKCLTWKQSVDELLSQLQWINHD